MSLADRFWRHVQKTDSCWLWTGYCWNGYGRFHATQGTIGAHRVAYELMKGPIPSDKELDHLCHNRRCVNPAHLEPVEHRTNMRRSPRKQKTHCLNGHPFAGDNLYFDGRKRFCRQCFRDRSKRRYWAMKSLT